jgi:hypothetical protein
MALQRPTSLLVFGILQITFGSIGILLAICGGVMELTGFQKSMQQAQQQPAAASNDPNQKEMAEFQARLQKETEAVPYYDAERVTSTVLHVVLCILLIVGGIGLIKVASWGRMLSLGYACLSILTTIGTLIYQLVIAIPAMNAFLEKENPTNNPLIKMTASVSQWAMYGAPCGSILMLIFPVLVLTWMLRPSIAEAFRKGGIEVFDGAAPPYPQTDTPIDYDDRRKDARPGPASEGITSDEPQQY